MKPIIKTLKIHLMLLLLAGYLFNGCSSGTKPEDTATKETLKKEVEEEEEDEEKKEEDSGEEVFEHWKENKGIGPVKSVTLEAAIDQTMADAGAQIYKSKCTSCHKPDRRFIGPAPKGIFERRTPEWIMNMILNPEVMVKEDPIAKQLLTDFNLSPMANQNLTEDEARKVLEYFRTL